MKFIENFSGRNEGLIAPERSLCGVGEVDAIALVIKLRETVIVSGDGYTKFFCGS